MLLTGKIVSLQHTGFRDFNLYSATCSEITLQIIWKGNFFSDSCQDSLKKQMGSLNRTEFDQSDSADGYGGNN